MSKPLSVALIACALSAIGLSGQSAVVDTSRLGPPVGAAAPAFTGIDQFGKSHTLASTSGRQGTMLVFFRSADW